MAFEMRLDRLDLTNFRRFEHYSVDFDERMTVLVGENGSGKSSVVDAARIALSAFVAGVSRAPELPIAPSDARMASVDVGGITDQQAQHPVVVRATGRLGEKDVPVAWARSLGASGHSSGPAEAAPRPDFQEMGALARECRDRIEAGETDLVLPVVVCYGTDRTSRASGPTFGDPSDEGTGSRRTGFSRQDGYRGALGASIDYRQMLEWFYKMTAQDVQRAQSQRPKGESPLFSAVRGAVERCFRLVTGRVQVRVTYNLDVDDLDVEYLDSDGSVRRMPVGMLSDGYRSTLGMVADIAYRMALLNPALGGRVVNETPGVVLIDEVDLHLHPLWQARVLGDLHDIFPRVQFVVTTHAPTVVSSVEARCVRVLGNGGTAAQSPGTEVYGSDAGRVLVSVMGAPERPREVQEKFDEVYDLLDAGDLGGARSRLDELESRIGGSDTGIVAARTALALEEADARYAADS